MVEHWFVVPATRVRFPLVAQKTLLKYMNVQNPENEDILELFAQNEKKVSLLYSLYSRKKGADKYFWQDLSEQETGHAKIIRRARQKLKKRGESIKENKYSRQIIEYVSGFIDEEIAKAKKKRVFSDDAFEVALRLEQSMIENKCFEIFSPKNKEIASVMRRLNRDTNKHSRLLLSRIKKNDNKKIPKEN